MKIAILGSPQSGQQELFSLLTGISLDTILQKPLEIQNGICQVIDQRITKLKELYNPKKTTYARIEYLLLPDFNLQGPGKDLILKQMKNADELCWIIRMDSAKENIQNFVSELILLDLVLIEKRLENIEKEQKKKFAQQKANEKELMEICKKQLESEKVIRDIDFSPEQQKQIRTYQFLTMKPIILVINIPEDKIKDHGIAKSIADHFNLPSMQISVEIEKEISQLEEKDRIDFMKELGIDQPALDKMNCLAFEGLGLISFFTVGEDEVRAWPIKRNATAPEAGSAIHSDIEKGFVRAEMCRYEDLLEHGSEQKLKELGKYQLKGRDYIVQDGDCLSFRFNV